MKYQTMKTLLFCVVGIVGESAAFSIANAGSSGMKRPLHAPVSTPNTRHTELSMMPLDPSSSFAGEFVPSTLVLASSLSATPTLENNSDVEAEVLIDLSHVAMDFSGLLTPSSKAMSRLVFSMVGRLLVLGADWVPDHSIHPEELVFQLFFMGVTLAEVLKAPRN